MVATGGRDITAQAIELSRRPHIIVATPGRLADLMTTSNDTSLFSRLKFLVMDEADRMMDPSFAESLRVVLRVLPSASRQTLLFSATITPQLEAIQSSKALPPLIIKVSQRFEAVERLKQSFIFTPSHLRDHALFHLFTDAEEAVAKDKSVIIFASRPQTVERLRLMLRRLKIDSSGLHSLLTQNQRLATLERFKSHKLNLLIATDVGGRGLDIPDVDLVINYDLPADPADYMHRVGRTARMGK
ncbi:P-loop containing nucleoside triphosphate hydrolase protein, partial [Caulochytrium protostelioides]